MRISRLSKLENFLEMLYSFPLLLHLQLFINVTLIRGFLADMLVHQIL